LAATSTAKLLPGLKARLPLTDSVPSVVAGPDRAEHRRGGQDAGAANESHRADRKAVEEASEPLAAQRSGADRGRAGVGRGAVDREGAGADLFQRAIALSQTASGFESLSAAP
jgi:hypothetical protein